MLESPTLEKILRFQKSEITEHRIYAKLACSAKDPRHREILERLSREELGHYQFWKRFSGRDVPAGGWTVWIYVWISRILGLTFGLKLMESGEGRAQIAYAEVAAVIPNARELQQEEEEHEKQILGLLDEKRLRYVSSAVLGLNDALVELTGALAGYTLALQNARLIAMVGLITGIAASFSMASSEYLSTKSEGDSSKNPVLAALYTGCAYVLTVTCLIFPFLVLNRVFLSLSLSLGAAVIIIALFTFYTSVAQELPFKKRFFEMLSLSFGVSALSFGIGWIIRAIFHVEA
ncbi:MAG: VIT1/CCC1 transporter family protein [Candidatus Omnitrophota bacterium]|jgi:VIT1/CCC1 family predicted Fe2+/Mn2+ transporter